MIIMHDGVEIFCLPDSAHCKAARRDIFDVDDCPKGLEVCEPASCEYYSEEDFERDPDREYELKRDEGDVNE